MKTLLLLSMLVITTVPALAQGGKVSDADAAAIRAAALDYIEGWYEGNAERMERAVHPELAKRMVRTDPQSNQSSLNQQSAMTLVQSTRAGYGKSNSNEQRQKDVTILDVYENAASMRSWQRQPSETRVWSEAPSVAPLVA